MKSIIKPAIFLLINLVLNFLIFVQYLKSTNYSGGEVGMLPIVILIVSVISFIVSLILISIINSFKRIDILKSILIYNLVYFIGIIFSGLNPISEKGFYENVDLFIIIIEIFSMILTLISSFLFIKYFKKI